MIIGVCGFISKEILIELYSEVCVLLLFCRPVSIEKKCNLKFERFSLDWGEIVIVSFISKT